MKIAARAAKSNATVLLFGESGTGKELFARLVWEESARSSKKFLPVHTGAIESSLLASTLFGHEKGAFTGADKLKKGLIEEADGGTIFLDEIGEINGETQVKLLRVLQEGEFMRVGGTEPVKVDVRVICATNRDLEAAVKEGKFREDLYYRLNVIKIHLPPLRDRVGDIADLVRHYVALMGGMEKGVSSEAMAALERYSWPGNVRQLRNVVERMVVLSAHDVLDVGDLPPEITATGDTAGRVAPPVPQQSNNVVERVAHDAPPIQSLADIERHHIVAVLESCGGNKKLAAERLGISRSSLYEKLKEFDGTCSQSGHGLSDRRTETSETCLKTP
jgi:DNA-binding NtrC family response regulator